MIASVLGRHEGGGGSLREAPLMGNLFKPKLMHYLVNPLRAGSTFLRPPPSRRRVTRLELAATFNIAM
eukprot:1174648-Heterocapsa_arctica.AAC.1